jgi:hypothetical protein
MTRWSFLWMAFVCRLDTHYETKLAEFVTITYNTFFIIRERMKWIILTFGKEHSFFTELIQNTRPVAVISKLNNVYCIKFDKTDKGSELYYRKEKLNFQLKNNLCRKVSIWRQTLRHWPSYVWNTARLHRP